MVKPLFDRVVLKPVKEQEKTMGGLYIPTQDKVSFMATVVAVGPGFIHHGDEIKMEVKVGDTVIYDKLKANEFKVDGEDLIVISQRDILAIIE